MFKYFNDLYWRWKWNRAYVDIIRRECWFTEEQRLHFCSRYNASRFFWQKPVQLIELGK